MRLTPTPIGHRTAIYSYSPLLWGGAATESFNTPVGLVSVERSGRETGFSFCPLVGIGEAGQGGLLICTDASRPGSGIRTSFYGLY